MLSRKFGLSRPTILVWMLLSISIGCAKGDQMPVLSDEQVVERLASRTPQEADAAVGEIMRGGARLTGLLLKHRGNRQPFAGTSLFNPRASILLPIPTEGFNSISHKLRCCSTRPSRRGAALSRIRRNVSPVRLTPQNGGSEQTQPRGSPAIRSQHRDSGGTERLDLWPPNGTASQGRQ